MIVNLEKAIGKKVYDSDGKVAGRLEEVHGDWRGDECIVKYYTLATKKKSKSMTLSHVLMFLLRQMGAQKTQGAAVVTWDQMDLSDPKRPRLRVRAEELVRIG